MIGRIGSSIICLVLASTAAAEATQLRDDGAIVLERAGEVRTFRPHFTLLYTESDPQLEMRRGDLGRVSYDVPSWMAVHDEVGGVRAEDTSVVGGDGLDPDVVGGNNEGRTADLFHAAEMIDLRPNNVSIEDGVAQLGFEAGRHAAVRARFDASTEPPRIEVELTAGRDGWYSLGYTGGPAASTSTITEIWQPLIWHEQRIPEQAFATPSFQCPLPTALAEWDGVTVGVAASTDMIPFQPLPRLDNARFAVTLLDRTGEVQPSVFAPLLGGAGSFLELGETVRFMLHPVAHDAPLVDTYEHLARELAGFRDRRENLDINLNGVIENMIDYAMSHYSRFNEELRGCSYDTDVPDAVKNVSALHPLSVAIVTDDERIYHERALPIWEYLLSREKLLFNLDPSVTTQSPSRSMHGPSANVSELAYLHAMSGGSDHVSLRYARELLGMDRELNLDTPVRGSSWQANLALWHATGDEVYHDAFRLELDRYFQERLNQPARDFSDPYSSGMFFWTSFVPNWMDLHFAWRSTGSRSVLGAAHDGARRFTTFTWLAPQPTDGTVRVNKGGTAPVYWYLEHQGHRPIAADERDVPAWWVDALGLTPESSGTASGHRGIFMATYAPFMLRIAAETGESFLRDVARASVVGRYRNFPGYHINTERTDVFMQAEYPLREHKALSYNSFHYNHPWPMIATLIDYLVSDLAAASDGAIDFPARFVEGYAYLRQRVYGDRPGRFYDIDGVHLWMPRGLVDAGHPQLNVLTARTDDQIVVALVNQSDRMVRTQVQLDTSLAGLNHSTLPVRIWRDNTPVDGGTSIHQGMIELEVSPHGLTAFAVGACQPVLGAMTRARNELRPLGPHSHRELEAGDSRAMLLTQGRSLTSGYVYSRLDMGELDRVDLSYRLDDDPWTEITDKSFPFEFRFDVPDHVSSAEMRVTATHTNGKVERSPVIDLLRESRIHSAAEGDS
ncbi:MAG: hypothetical protein AAGI30_07465 [Planctomycetota bacterium]